MGYSVGSGRTISRQATGDTTNLPFVQYAARLARDNANAATNQIRFVSSLESVNSIPLAGKAVAYSFYARAGANYSGGALTTQLATGTGTDQNLLTAGYTGLAYAVNSTATLTTTWQRFTYTGTIGATATEIGMEFAWTPTGTAGVNDWVEITGIQLEVGSIPTQFSRAGATIQGELAACQRYYYRLSSPSAGYKLVATGQFFSTTAAGVPISFPVRMRVVPTAFDTTATASDYGLLTAAGGTATMSALPTADYYTTDSVSIAGTLAGSGVAGNATILFFNGSAAYLGFSAEL
jgi:hypothetical protein